MLETRVISGTVNVMENCNRGKLKVFMHFLLVHFSFEETDVFLEYHSLICFSQ
jgi:hypothetical protein